MEQFRNQWLDIAKGIAIILMVVGHTTIPKYASDFIWAFHMPLFFIASGWTTNWSKWSNKSFTSFVAKKTRTLIVPFIIYSVIVLSIACPLGFITLSNWLRKGWMGFALWFVPVLYFSLIGARIIMSLHNQLLRVVVAVILALLGSLLRSFDILIPWTMSSVPYATFLIIVGAALKKYEKFIEFPRWYILLCGFCMTVLISHFYRLDMAWNHINPILPITMGALVGTAMVFTISSYIVNGNKLISEILQSIGRETYIILAFSQIIIMAMLHFFEWNSLFRYTLMVIILVLLKYAKDGVNNLAKTRIL